ncbi:MAG: DUF3859 domain-containing protein, partial [Paracoccaceae bacterium]
TISWVVALWIASGAVADILPPQGSEAIESLQVGVFCRPKTVSEMPAPGTQDGFISITEESFTIHNDSQQVPAALGLAFGVRAIAKQTIANVRVTVQRPGRDTPDVWFDNFAAGEISTDFFSFDRDEERVTGLWTFEAWDGDTRLYHADFEVVPEVALPDLVAQCQATS